MNLHLIKMGVVLSGLTLPGLLLSAPGKAQMLPVPPMAEMAGAPVGMPPAVGTETGAEAGVAAPAEGTVAGSVVNRRRDPFWPVGYVPKKRVTQPQGGGGMQKGSAVVEVAPEPVRLPAWDEARKRLDIRGISLIHEKNSRTPKYLAMIAGKLFETGNMVSVKYDDRLYRWRVKDITTEGVSLQKVDVRDE